MLVLVAVDLMPQRRVTLAPLVAAAAVASVALVVIAMVVRAVSISPGQVAAVVLVVAT